MFISVRSVVRSIGLLVFILCCFGNTCRTQSISGLPTPTEIFKKVSPAVVMVFAGNKTAESQGTGFLVSEDGRIITNYHVIEHMKQTVVRLASGEIFDVTGVVDVDKRRDLVVLKIKAADLPYLSLGRSANVDVGAKVYTISNPRMLENTLSEGIVSAVREEDGVREIQITAPISHGSSGGPVLDSAGRVIGVVQATQEDAQNVNFAIPIEYVKGLLATDGTVPLSTIYEPPPPSSTNPEAKGPIQSGSAPPVANPQEESSTTPTIDGSWSAMFADGKGSGHLDFNLIQNSDGLVVGTYTSSLGGGGRIKGQLTDTEFRFELTQTIDNCPGIYKGIGQRIGNSVTGTYTGNDCAGDRGSGTFTMTRGGAAPAPATASVAPSGVAQPATATQKVMADFMTAAITSIPAPSFLPTEQDVRATLGEPTAHRYLYDQAQNITGDIYAFQDATHNWDHVEVAFDAKTHRMTSMYLYPAKLTTWANCKQLWGDDVSVLKKDGNKFYSYKNRRVNVLLDRNNKVISLGLY